jgi:cyclopropane-fatty-acyl-phospholipid synthase
MGSADTVARAAGPASSTFVSAAVRRGVARLAEACLKCGGLPVRFELPDGGGVDFGAAPTVTLRIRDAGLLADLSAPTIGLLAEAFIDGRMDIEGDLLEAMPLAERLAESGGAGVAERLLGAGRRHRRTEDRAAIAHHYDVGNEFYQLWLDERMIYSCAYYRRGDESIDAAQLAKLDHICRKLRLAPGERLLDVGCGWGGLVLHAAARYRVQAVGITLSSRQAELARERVERAGLQGRVEILLLDYRDLAQRYAAGSFDKVASIGMFEHVGLRNLPDYFGVIARVLRDRGLFLNHGITSVDVDSRPVGSGVGDFIGRHVFPHGELPHLHVAAREMSAAGFEITDVESLRPHYARTLAAWYRRLEARRAEAERLVPERTLRVWRAYLAGCSWGFERGWTHIYQLLGSRQAEAGLTQLPLTRDWIYA